ncbi:(2Fe-2S)-binding protein [Advenella kashmirensis W13003]|uniref:(2Fe-2S)-binding protein n=1 Tax=Advenella kashmirensis W13003 TaxID=1424334 RepID=V8QQ06_9BURK|nr:aromatic ring-hydroxylating dioxygenase subunit alpha [Advenella kashmirensis]ETF01433.1 (2Fe-2S)-binding protein [Advenella kashmirensis W13003]
MFLKNAWYVAAWSQDISHELFPLQLLNEHLVFYRQKNGQVVALEDACPHRKLPLSMGRLIDDAIECGYHGLTFNGQGTCIFAPGAKIPRAATVRHFAVTEKYGLVWVWMGDAQQADPALIPHIAEYGDPDWGTNQGDAMIVECNYLYMTDNLLDPSHVAWVHRSSFGNSACENEPLTTTVMDNGVIVSRWMHDTEVAPFYAKFVRFSGNCDRKQHYEVRYPSHAIIKAVFTPAGTGGDDAPRHPDVFLMDSYNFLTPVDDKTTRYFWFQLRNFSPNDQAISAQFAEGVRKAFEEDRIVLGAVQKGMDNRRTPFINLKLDGGPIKFRKGLQRLIELEQQSQPEAIANNRQTIIPIQETAIAQPD